MFMPDKSEGFTQAGVERLNVSIRTFVWAILGAQAKTRSNILKAGTGSTLKSSSWPTSKTPSPRPSTSPAASLAIRRRSYASSPLDFVLGLYLAPSDMAFHPGNVQGYNNEIVIAGSESAIGHNPGINESEQIGKTTGDKPFEGQIAAPAGTDHKWPLSGRPAGSPPTPATVAPQQHASAAAATSHEEEKTALIAAGVGVGLVALWLSLR